MTRQFVGAEDLTLCLTLCVSVMSCQAFVFDDQRLATTGSPSSRSRPSCSLSRSLLGDRPVSLTFCSPFAHSWGPAVPARESGGPESAPDEAVAGISAVASDCAWGGCDSAGGAGPGPVVWSGDGHLVGPQLEEVVGGADEAPFAGDGGKASAGEPSESEVRFEVPEHGFDRDLAFGPAFRTSA